ncbi:hypothetical protein [Cellulosimicrobium protaetiae]
MNRPARRASLLATLGAVVLSGCGVVGVTFGEPDAAEHGWDLPPVTVADDGTPSTIHLYPDPWQGEHVGRTSDGRQFFLTTPFEPGGPAWVALYTFDADGALLDATIRRVEESAEEYDRATTSLLATLGDHENGPVALAPFEVEHDGRAFGLVRGDYDGTVVYTAEPGDYMAFYAPWDTGEYDT